MLVVPAASLAGTGAGVGRGTRNEFLLPSTQSSGLTRGAANSGRENKKYPPLHPFCVAGYVTPPITGHTKTVQTTRTVPVLCVYYRKWRRGFLTAVNPELWADGARCKSGRSPVVRARGVLRRGV